MSRVAQAFDDAASHSRPAVIDAAHLARQRDWSERTFGPGTRLHGVLDHIRKEVAEVEADPTDVTEWIDVVILALDGAWRAGYEPQAIIDALVGKQARNEARTWPDWRTMSPDQAIEHVEAGDAPAPGGEAAYKVGDPDPTWPPAPDEVETTDCGAPDVTEAYACTWPFGHAHPQHVAGDGGFVLAVWNTALPAPAAREDSGAPEVDRPALAALRSLDGTVESHNAAWRVGTPEVDR